MSKDTKSGHCVHFWVTCKGVSRFAEKMKVLAAYWLTVTEGQRTEGIKLGKGKARQFCKELLAEIDKDLTTTKEDPDGK